MIRPRLTRALLGLALALAGACTHVPVDRDRAAFGASLGADTGPATGTAPARDRCYAVEPIPAIYEQVMGEIRVVPPHVGPDGYFNPAVYRRAPVPELVRERGTERFETPCDAEVTRDFITALQRALAARGYYAGAATGEMDRPTRAAIRRYQAERGRDTDQLSIETARSLGLIAVDLDADGAG